MSVTNTCKIMALNAGSKPKNKGKEQPKSKGKLTLADARLDPNALDGLNKSFQQLRELNNQNQHSNSNNMNNVQIVLDNADQNGSNNENQDITDPNDKDNQSDANGDSNESDLKNNGNTNTNSSGNKNLNSNSNTNNNNNNKNNKRNKNGNVGNNSNVFPSAQFDPSKNFLDNPFGNNNDQLLLLQQQQQQQQHQLSQNLVSLFSAPNGNASMISPTIITGAIRDAISTIQAKNVNVGMNKNRVGLLQQPLQGNESPALRTHINFDLSNGGDSDSNVVDDMKREQYQTPGNKQKGNSNNNNGNINNNNNSNNNNNGNGKHVRFNEDPGMNQRELNPGIGQQLGQDNSNRNNNFNQFGNLDGILAGLYGNGSNGNSNSNSNSNETGTGLLPPLPNLGNNGGGNGSNSNGNTNVNSNSNVILSQRLQRLENLVNNKNGNMVVPNGVGNTFVPSTIGGSGIPPHTPASLLRQCGLPSYRQQPYQAMVPPGSTSTTTTTTAGYGPTRGINMPMGNLNDIATNTASLDLSFTFFSIVFLYPCTNGKVCLLCRFVLCFYSGLQIMCRLSAN